MTWILRLLLRLVPTRLLLAVLVDRRDFCGIVAAWLPAGDSGAWTWHVRRLETREDAFAVMETMYEQIAIDMPSRDPVRPRRRSEE